MKGTIQSQSTKFTAGGAIVVNLRVSGYPNELSYFGNDGKLPAWAVEGEEVEFSVQEVTKGKFTNYYIRVEGDTPPAKAGGAGGYKTASGGSKPAGGGYNKPMDPETQARVTRLSVLSSAATFCAQTSDATVEDAIDIAKRFYEYATTGK